MAQTKVTAAVDCKNLRYMHNIVNMIPNCITLLNLLSGCIAIIFAFSPDTQTGNLLGWQWSVLMMGVAALFDFLDGAVARMLNAKSMIGKELDSLSDLVSFGVAPSLLLMNVLLLAGAQWWSYAALFIPMMGALRLAKFNVDDSQSTVFKGLPIPANAIFWIGVVAAMMSGSLRPTVGIAIAVIIVMGTLMVCNLPMFSLKFKNFALWGNISRYVIIAATVVFVALLGLPGFSATIILYILISVFNRIIKLEVNE